ncbi:MAG: UDP-glucose/GDP-mannose dehydrogenase family protein [Gammaproteobacteria bacterium]|nr:MAG: UDP-glucose/GDP-mannose dehydrogenase family protein [Gammaproteobacteria bacterium]
MKLTIIGTGYVGLVTGACFAEMGNTVTCVDVDVRKIENLRKGVLPIYEPGLEPVVINNHKEGRLRFATSLDEPAALEGNVFFIAVGTPPGEDGSADLQYVLAAARDVGRHITGYSVIVDKSTVPVGTAGKVHMAVVEELKKRSVDIEFDVVSNPEFLKEGAAVEDFMKPDRVVVGTDSDKARTVMHDLYAPFMRTHERLFFMGVKEAEMTKYAANAMLATKISFMNEISNLCDRLGVDVESVRQGIGSDSRIGYSFIYPGAGYGGSCFPKDVKALVRMAHEQGFDPLILNAVEARNEAQKYVLFAKIAKRFGTDLRNHVFGLWGLAFKPGTDDMREAPSKILLEELIGAGARVRAYDPVAMDVSRRELPAEWFSSGKLELAAQQYDALKGVDALILVTEWKPFRHPDFVLMKQIMKQPVIFDGRNQYDPAQLRADGFEYSGIGR